MTDSADEILEDIVVKIAGRKVHCPASHDPTSNPVWEVHCSACLEDAIQEEIRDAAAAARRAALKEVIDWVGTKLSHCIAEESLCLLCELEKGIKAMMDGEQPAAGKHNAYAEARREALGEYCALLIRCRNHLAYNAITEDLRELYQDVRAKLEERHGEG